MPAPRTVIIGAIELLDALSRSAAVEGDVFGFSEHEPLKALEAVTTRRPSVIALERLFAATSRGAALINRIKADPSLSSVEIRVVSVDGTYRVSPRRAEAAAPPPSTGPAPAAAGPGDAGIDVVSPDPAAGAETPRNLDYTGTRRLPRSRLREGTEVQVDGALAMMVDLSAHGAQVLCPTPLKPQQQVRMILADDLGMAKISASVVWAFFEIPKGIARYRAGVEFKDAERRAVDAFCRRHQTRPD